MLRPIQKLLHKVGSFYTARIETEPLLKSHPKTFAGSTCNTICMYLESNLCRGSNNRASYVCILELDTEPACRDMMKRKKKSIAGHWDPCYSMGQAPLEWGLSDWLSVKALGYNCIWFGWIIVISSCFMHHICILVTGFQNLCIHDRHSSEDTGKRHWCIPLWTHIRLLLLESLLFPPLSTRDTCLIDGIAQRGNDTFRNCHIHVKLIHLSEVEVLLIGHLVNASVTEESPGPGGTAYNDSTNLYD